MRLVRDFMRPSDGESQATGWYAVSLSAASDR